MIATLNGIAIREMGMHKLVLAIDGKEISSIPIYVLQASKEDLLKK